MTEELPHCDDLFTKFFDPWYDDEDRCRRLFRATRPDIAQAPELVGLLTPDLGPLNADGQTEVLGRIASMLDAARGDWPEYLPVAGNLDLGWIDAFDRYYDRARIHDVIDRSDPKDFGNDYLVLCCEFGAALGHVLRDRVSHLVWWLEWPYWESSLFDPKMGSVIPVFHWAVKKTSAYGVDDGFAAKVRACIKFLNESRKIRD